MLSAIPLYRTIDEYNLNINIPLPRYPDFDVRDFEQNMETVRLEMPSFRHNFYQVALLESGGGTVTSAGQAFDLDNFTIFSFSQARSTTGIFRKIGAVTISAFPNRFTPCR